MSHSDPRRTGTVAERLAYWEERLANAERLGRPGHIAHVRGRVDVLRRISEAITSEGSRDV